MNDDVLYTLLYDCMSVGSIIQEREITQDIER